ncbi:unnamed protein product [Amoebophrya sp. A25]|nr:unnamed protein product [Amoebophrya sp. A25]|eukprot:GSA25T00025181001.1
MGIERDSALFDGTEEMKVIGAGVAKPRVLGGGFRTATKSSKGSSHAEQTATNSGMELQIVGTRSGSQSPGGGDGGRGALMARRERDRKDALMTSMEADLAKLRQELSSLAASSATKDALVQEYAPKLRASHDALLQQLEAEYNLRKKERDRKLTTQPSTSAGISRGRSAGNQAHHFQFPPDHLIVDAQEEMISGLKSCFERQKSVSVGGGLARDLVNSAATDGAGSGGEEAVSVQNLCLAIEVDPKLKPWLGRLARLDCYTDETLTLQEVVNQVRNLHPVSRILWTQFREYLTRGGSSGAGTSGITSGMAGGSSGGATGRSRAHVQSAKGKKSNISGGTTSGPGSSSLKTTKTSSVAGTAPAKSNKKTAQPGVSKTPKTSGSARSSTTDLQKSLDAKTEAALRMQREEAAIVPSKGRSGGPCSSPAVIGMRVLLQQEFQSADAAYRKLDQRGTGFISVAEFSILLRSCGERFVEGFADGSVEKVCQLLRNEDMEINISAMLGTPAPVGSAAAVRVDAAKEMPLVPADEAFSAYTFGQPGPGNEDGPAPKPLVYQNFFEEQGESIILNKMEVRHWQELEAIFNSIDESKVDIHRFLYKVRDHKDSAFLQNDWLAIVVEEVRDPLTGELRKVTLDQCLQYLEALKIYENQPWSWFRKRILEAPRKRHPKILEYAPSADVDHESGNQWLQLAYNVDSRVLGRVHDVYKHCQKTKPDFPVKKADFVLQLKQKQSLLNEFHRKTLMDVEDKSFVPMWAEILPGLASHERDLLRWSDVLQVIKQRCDVGKALRSKQQARGSSTSPRGSGSGKATPTSKKSPPVVEPIVVTTMEDDAEAPPAARQLAAMVRSIENADEPFDVGIGSSFVAPIVTQPTERALRSPANKRSPSGSKSPSFRFGDISVVKGDDFAAAPPAATAASVPRVQDRLAMPIGKLSITLDTDYTAFLQAAQPETRLEAIRRRLCSLLELDDHAASAASCLSVKSLTRGANLAEESASSTSEIFSGVLENALTLHLETEGAVLEAVEERLVSALGADLNALVGYRVLYMKWQNRILIRAGEKAMNSTVMILPASTGARMQSRDAPTSSSMGNIVAPPGSALRSPAQLSREELELEERKYFDWSSGRNVMRKHNSKYAASTSASKTSEIRAPAFASEDSYWDVKKGTRIKDKKMAEDLAAKEREELHSTGFVANPIPQHVFLPRYSQMDVADRRSPGDTLGRSSSAAKKDLMMLFRCAVAFGSSSDGERRRSKSNWDDDFAPVLDSYQKHAKHMLYKANRSSSVPPGHDRVYKALYPEEGGAAGNASTTSRAAPVVTVQKRKPVVPPPESYTFKAGKPAEKSVVEVEKEREFAFLKTTGSVPDFKAAHSKFQRQIRERKLANQKAATKAQPFVFQATTRVMRAPPIDETDLRWQRAGGKYQKQQAPDRVKQLQLMAEKGREIKTTAKALQYQQHMAAKIQRRREEEATRKAEEQLYQEPNEQVKERVQSTLNRTSKGGGASAAAQTDMEVEKRTYGMRMNQIATERRWQKKLSEMNERLKTRPLLMERTQIDQARERARQRALLRVRTEMTAKGVKNVENFFNNEELNFMDGY